MLSHSNFTAMRKSQKAGQAYRTIRTTGSYQSQRTDSHKDHHYRRSSAHRPSGSKCLSSALPAFIHHLRRYKP